MPNRIFRILRLWTDAVKWPLKELRAFEEPSFMNNKISKCLQMGIIPQKRVSKISSVKILNARNFKFNFLKMFLKTSFSIQRYTTSWLLQRNSFFIATQWSGLQKNFFDRVWQLEFKIYFKMWFKITSKY